jgi:hypothetical protein
MNRLLLLSIAMSHGELSVDRFAPPLASCAIAFLHLLL